MRKRRRAGSERLKQRSAEGPRVTPRGQAAGPGIKVAPVARAWPLLDLGA
ncbi:hypothetical protein K7W42_10710 [Deinococcus sp. HMF7604]|nr:hypothetical protein [Deinococcus betulae]MBZ9751336.1 hypothetical protein [Deinococcus betulae]